MKNLYIFNFLLVTIILLSFTNCSNPKTEEKTDYDQLYALWYDDNYRDSLAQVLQPKVEKALSLSNSTENRIYIDSVLSKLRWTRDSISFKKLSNKAINFAQKSSDKYMLANIYNNIGMYHHDLHKLDSTFYYYVKAESIYKDLGDSIKIGEMEFYQARVLAEKGLFIESEVKVNKSLTLLRNTTLNPIPFEANQLMAICHLERKDFQMSKIYFIKALELMEKDYNVNQILEQQKLQMAIAAVYLNLANVSNELKEYEAAINYATKAIEYGKNSSPPILLSLLTINKERAYYELNKKNKSIADPDTYIAELKKGISITKNIKNYRILMDLYLMSAELYLDLKQHEKAFENAENIYKIAVQGDVKPMQKVALEFLITHKEYENKDLVLNLININNALKEEDYATRNRFARIIYETEKIEIENTTLKNSMYILTIVSLVVIITLLLGVYIYRLKNKNKEIRYIKNQQKANESIYQIVLEKSRIALEVKNNVQSKVAKDIHDGVINGLFMIRFNLQQMQTENIKTKDILVSELQKLEKHTRDISHSLIDKKLFETNSFISLIEDLISFQKNNWNTLFTLEYDRSIDIEKLPALYKVNIYFIIREAIQNVNKYSEATLCTISFVKTTNLILIKINDNGIGFEKKIAKHGIGLQNMMERAVALKTRLIIHSKKDSGTEISFKIKNN